MWVVTRLDRSAYQVTYHRIEPSRHVARVDVRCKALTKVTTEATTIYSYIGLSEKGNEEIGAMTQESYDEKMLRWRKWINEYLQGLGLD